MATNQLKLPPGFQLEQQPEQQPTPQGVQLPPGFELESAPSRGATARWDEQPSAVSRFVGNAWDEIKKVPGGMLHMFTNDPLGFKGTIGGQEVEIPGAARDTIAGARHVAGKAVESYGEGDYLGAAQHAANAAVPMFGPGLDEATEKMNAGDVAGGLGQTLGLAAAAKVPEALGAIGGRIGRALTPGEGAAVKLMEDSLPQGSFETPEARTTAAKALLREELPITKKGVPGLDSKVRGYVESQNALADKIPGTPVTSGPSLENAAALRSRLARQVNPDSSVAAVDRAIEEFNRRMPQNVSVREALDMKRETNRNLRPEHEAKRAGKDVAAGSEAEIALNKGITDQVHERWPELADSDAAMSDLIGARKGMVAAVKRAPGGMAYLKAVGKGISTLGLTLPKELMSTVLRDPAVKSRLAIAISKANKGVSIEAARSQVLDYARELSGGAGEVRGAANAAASPAYAGDEDKQKAPPMNTAMDVPAGSLSRNAQGQYISNKARLQDYAK